MSAEKLTRSVPRTVLPTNELRLNHLAVRLHRERRQNTGSQLSSADVDERNARATLSTRATRSKSRGGLTSAEEASYAGGLSDQEWWAFQAYAMCIDTRHQLTMAVYDAAVSLAIEQSWSYKYNDEHPQVMCLARLTVDEWLEPARYQHRKRTGSFETVSVYARAMHMDRKTWNSHWRKRWLILKPLPRDWYLHALHTIEANYAGSLRQFKAPDRRAGPRTAQVAQASARSIMRGRWGNQLTLKRK